MRTKARCLVILVTAVLIVPCAWAAAKVVDVDGTIYTVGVVRLTGAASPCATALSYSVRRTSGPTEAGFISPTQDAWADRDPQLVLTPMNRGPFLVWSRSDGSYDQIAYSRFSGEGWTDFKYLTSEPQDHIRPSVGVDANGTGYVVWVEPAGSGSVLFATFDPTSGNLIISPRDLFLELVRLSPPELLTSGRSLLPADGWHVALDISLDGGNDAPAVPPVTRKVDPPVSGSISLSPVCTRAVAAVVRERALAIGVLEGGVAVKYYRSVIPEGAEEDYLEKFLTSLLNRYCQ